MKIEGAVLEILMSGGWLMVPIIACSIVSLAIIGERFWSLNSEKILPRELVSSVWSLHKANQLDNSKVRSLSNSSPLGRVLAAGIINQSHGREIMRESIEEVGRQVAHELERYLNSLGTIASITPLLGLLGTVIGMINVFAAITANGVGDPTVLAGGISQALITTASGMSVAIPSLMFYRYFRGKVDELVIKMESEALKLVEMMHGERE
ncbi:MAG: biopolymer transport protein ExbB [Cycloclasticus pugetii]|uniref:Biopolymer transporter protein ExbB n=2 Tax=Cycloclasticus TaxID=34067 RepID=S5TXZ8_9GAMM|nr:MotA/TolQ/ExbB proton channel family protein [Cycloclasticus pugetii]AFT66881.1 Biopolymer transport protein [Cycloclasticus sp. P1]AGS40055.1 Biopolymer transporter protein ExbB [Cycloclasticus zancles 78-ME]ATI03483.1 MotA/TolQ/ExbB proton channel family protein [Cycloclasticus sp. PY97N]PHR52109.1 MAG: MotA/TolQ/ExbB proton channel family protein [Cycloclasticus sp.]EPD13966.1 biopolymer transport protein [Cycloclasticus pugetii]